MKENGSNSLDSTAGDHKRSKRDTAYSYEDVEKDWADGLFTELPFNLSLIDLDQYVPGWLFHSSYILIACIK